MSKFKSALILSAAATLLSATPALAQYGSGSGGNRGASPVSQPRAAAPRPTPSAVNTRALEKRQEAWSKREELERKIARQEAQAKQYGSGVDGAKTTAQDAAQGAKDKAYGSGVDGAQDAAQGATDKAYGSGVDGAQDTAQGVTDKAYGSDTDAAKATQDAKQKAYGSGDKGATTVQEKAYGSGTPAQAPAQDTYNSSTTGSNLPLNCPAGTEAQPNGTCLLVDSSLLGF